MQYVQTQQNVRPSTANTAKGSMLKMQHGDLAKHVSCFDVSMLQSQQCCNTSNCFVVSCCVCVIVSVSFRLALTMLQCQQYPVALAGTVPLQLLVDAVAQQTLRDPSLKM